jgi:hypothetical protein
MGILARQPALAAWSLGGPRWPARSKGRPRGEGSAAAPVVFLHVPKTAGSSLTNMLLSQYPDERVYRQGGLATLSHLHPSEIDAYDLFCGHFDWSQLKYVPRNAKIITVLRDPVERILSLYKYWCSFPWDYAEKTDDFGIQYAKTVSMDEFFFDAPLGIRANYENAVVRQLVGADFCRPYVGFKLADEQIVQLAKYRIDSLDVCGVTEDFHGSSVRIAQCLRLETLQIRFDNRTPQAAGETQAEMRLRNRYGAAMAARLDQLTALDREVFGYARRKHHALAASRAAELSTLNAG